MNATSEARIHRAPGLGVAAISEGDAVRVEGAATYSQLGREASVPARSAVLISGSAACRMERTASRFLLICVPRAALTPMLMNPDAMLVSVVPRECAPSRPTSNRASAETR